MGIKRRKFLKIAGMSALGAVAVPAKDALAFNPIEWLDKKLGGFTPSEILLHMLHKPAGFKAGEALTAQQWAMVIDARQIDEEIAKACREACHKIHNVPDIPNPKHEIKWIWHDDFEHTFPGQPHEHMEEALEDLPFVVLCNHCSAPACVRVCPTKATFKRKLDGIVLMDMHRCIGCRFCMAACPYGARSFNWKDPRPYIKEQNMLFPTRAKGVVEKCNFCAERLAKGEMPVCVETANELCKRKGRKQAFYFGDLGNQDSEVRQALRERFSIRRKPELGTSPNVYYIV